MQKPVVGIDFGTSSSTVGLSLNGATSMVPLEGNHTSIPTCIFFNMEERELAVHFGRDAMNKYKEGYTGRLLRSLKSILGSSLAHDSTAIGFQSYKLTDVLCLFVSHLKEKAEQHAGVSIDNAIIGRPVFFVDNNLQADQEAENQLKDVALRAGFKNVRFQYEPIAAALAYELTLNKVRTVLVADIGGGTADFSVARLGPGLAGNEDRSADIMGNSGIHIGGTDLDRRLSYTSVMPHLGLGGKYRNPPIELPTAHYHTLSTWHLINSLYTKKSLSSISDMVRNAEDTDRVSRLFDIVSNRRGHELMQGVEDAKIALTDQSVVTKDFGKIIAGMSVDFTRDRFNAAIKDQVSGIKNTVSTLISSSGMSGNRIETVFYTGGTSAVPAIRDAINSLLPSAEVIDGDPMTAVGRGLAIYADAVFQKARISTAKLAPT